MSFVLTFPTCFIVTLFTVKKCRTFRTKFGFILFHIFVTEKVPKYFFLKTIFMLTKLWSQPKYKNMKIRALSSKTHFENQSSPKYPRVWKLDIYFCPFFETPTTFGQKKSRKLPFSLSYFLNILYYYLRTLFTKILFCWYK